MTAKLFLASTFTLGLLFIMLFGILGVIAFMMDLLSPILLIVLTIIFTLIVWLVGPWFNDFLYGWLYKCKWIGIDGLKQEHPKLAEHLLQLCQQNGIKEPKFGVIDDQNPTAFTYGSGKWNARIVVSQGIFHYLDEEEAKAVLAHEVGHIAHNDFIVMTMASLIVTLLYEIAWILMHTHSGGKNSGRLKLVGIAAYVFYLIGSYLLLYLSRTREYYADQFAGENASPAALARALVKIAYGIVDGKTEEGSTRLMQSTRAQGIFDYKAAKSYGLLASQAQSTGSMQATELAVVYDLKNPWAFLSELSSTHPLTGKRILALGEMASQKGEQAVIDPVRVKNYPVDKARMYKGFFTDLFIISPFTHLFVLILAIIAFFVWNNVVLGIGVFLLFLGVFGFIKTLYRYPSSEPVHASVAACMGDIYASPVRGTPVALSGQVIGRGVAGAVFSEDMMFQDNTGLIYLDFQSLIPFLGNLFFAWTKVEKLVGQTVKVRGWFIRSLGQLVILDTVTNGETVKSRQKLMGYIFAGLFLVLGALVTGAAFLLMA